MYEVEVKVEITESERGKLIELFNKGNFAAKEVVTQNDFYIEAKESEFGGYDLKRYRDEGHKIFYTEKIWEMIDGQKSRHEIEKEVTREEFSEEIKKYPDALKIQKDRQSFIGDYQDQKIHIDMDSIKFDHSPNMRYFIEAEVVTDDKGKIKTTKESMQEFLKTSLGKDNIIESPGMFNMAFNKL